MTANNAITTTTNTTTRRLTSRVRLAQMDSTWLLSEKNPDLGQSPETVLNRLGVNWTPELETVHDVRGRVIPDSRNIVRPDGTSLGIVGERFAPMGAPKLGAVCSQILDEVPDAVLLRGWQIDRGAKYGFKIRVGNPLIIGSPKIGDLTAIVLNLTGGNDGLTRWSLTGSITRLVCTNGMTTNALEARVFGKHTEGGSNRLQAGWDGAVRQLVAKAETEMGGLRLLAEKSFSPLGASQWLADFVRTGMGLKEANQIDRQIADFHSLLTSRETMMGAEAITAWHLYNAVTAYTTYGSHRTYEGVLLSGIENEGAEINRLAYDSLISA
jgi:hypothetical protein